MIRLTRKNTNESKAYKIFIDNAYHGDIKNNEIKEYAVSSGNHVIYAKIGFFKSNEVFVDIDNSTIELEIMTRKKELWISAPQLWPLALSCLIAFIIGNKDLLIIKQIK